MINNNENNVNNNKPTELIIKNQEIIYDLDFKDDTVLTENKFFNELNSLMINNEFRSFYNEYFNDFTDVKVLILYMKLYETLEVEYKKRNNRDIDRRLLIFIIKEVMNEKTTRKKIFESFDNYIKNNDKNFLDFFFNEKKIFSKKKSFEAII